MVKTILAVITATVFLASSAVPSSAQYYHRGGGYGVVVGGMVEIGTMVPAPLLVSVLGSGFLAGL